MKLSELVEKYRIEHDMSQRQFALACGLSNGYISMVEKNRNPKTGLPLAPSVPALAKIAKGMNISLTELLVQLDDMPIDIGIIPEDVVPRENKKTALDYENGLNGLELQLLNLLKQLSPEQKEFLLVQLEALVKRNKGSEETPF